MKSIFLAGNGTNITGTNTSFVTDEMETLGPQSMLILITVLVAFLILGTVLGNTLVIVAFIEDKRLRNSHHLFLLNLAICDFFIGAFCIPLYVPYVVTGKWMLGKSLCKLWLVVDNLMCTASAFNVVLISYDRFLAVTMAVLYRSQQYCHGKTVLKMATVWLLSSLLYSPAILLWENFQSNSSIPEGLCLPTYYYDWHFLLAASTFDFLLPLLSISFFNISIYWNIRTRSIKKCRQAMLPDALTNGQQVPYIIPLGLTSEWLHDLSETQRNVFRESVCQNLKRYFCKKAKPVPLERTLGQSSYIRIVKLSQDKKVAKSLFILVCVFCICWAPYSLLMTTRAACHDFCIASYWYEITFWLLWINSSINPIIYPLCHGSFRQAFGKIFCKYIRKTRYILPRKAIVRSTKS